MTNFNKNLVKCYHITVLKFLKRICKNATEMLNFCENCTENVAEVSLLKFFWKFGKMLQPSWIILPAISVKKSFENVEKFGENVVKSNENFIKRY